MQRTGARIWIARAVGNLGGFLGPYLIALLRKQTDSFAFALLALAVFLLIGGLVVLLASRLSSSRSA